MFNLMEVMTDDFKNMLSMIGQNIYINGEKKSVLISNLRTIQEFNDKYVSSDFNMQRGDIIHYDDKYWMLITQVGSVRRHSYKAQMRQIEHDVFFNLYYFGEKSNYLLKCPAIVQKTSDFNAKYSRQEQMITVQSEIHVFVQDNLNTRKIIAMSGKSDGQIIFGGRNYDIIGVSTENRGVLDITCALGINNSTSDYEQGIYWRAGKPSGWKGNIDESMYEFEGQPPVIAPDGLETNVGEIMAVVVSNASSNSLGSIAFSWTHDINKDIYPDWTGYKVTLLTENEVQLVTVDTTGTTYTFNDLKAGDYYVQIKILFATYLDRESSLPQTSGIAIVTGELQKPLPPSSVPTLISTFNISAVGETSQDGDGIITLAWTRDQNANLYSGFVGYRVYLDRDGTFNWIEQVSKSVGDTTTYSFTNCREGSYRGRIRSVYVNNGVETLGTIIYSESTVIKDNFSSSPW